MQTQPISCSTRLPDRCMLCFTSARDQKSAPICAVTRSPDGMPHVYGVHGGEFTVEQINHILTSEFLPSRFICSGLSKLESTLMLKLQL